MTRALTRPRSIVAGALLLAAIAAGLLVLLHDSSPKLGEGSYHQAGDGRWHAPDPTLNNDAVTRLDLTYREGEDASFTLSVRNDGDEPVTLVGASVLGANAMFARRSVRFAATPSEPRSVKPG